MQSLLQILVVNDIKKGTSKTSGQPYELQDCECVLLNDDGTPKQIGVLLLPKTMTGDHAPKPGIYTGTFALQPDLKTRQINARLIGLTPLALSQLKKQETAKA